MSESHDCSPLPAQALECEKKYEWLRAARLYEEALDRALGAKDVASAAGTSERIGYCYSRGAFQSKTCEDFAKSLRIAHEGYDRAGAFYEQTGNEGRLSSIHCKALGCYVDSLLASSHDEKKLSLDECWTLGKEVLRNCERGKNDPSFAGRCGDLLTCLIDRLDLEWDWEQRRRIVEEAIGWCWKVVAALGKANRSEELAKIYYLMVVFYLFAEECYDLGDKKKECVEKCQDCAQEVRNLSEKIKDHYLGSLSSYVVAWTTHSLKDDLESALEFAKEALQQGLETRDNFLIGSAYFLLAEITYWMMQVERNPDRREEEYDEVANYAGEAIRYCGIVSRDRVIANAHYRCVENLSYWAHEVETDLGRRRGLLEKAVRVGQEGVECARRSGIPSALQYNLHALSKAFYVFSKFEKETDRRTDLLEKALKCREEYMHILEQAFPFTYWGRGVGQSHYALIRTELAESETVKERKEELLQKAILDMEKCLESCRKSAEFYQQLRLYGTIGRYYGWFGHILYELYSLNGKRELAEEAVKAYEGAINAFGKVDMLARIAEAHWQIGRIKDGLGKYLEAGSSFEAASDEFVTMAGRIPQLKGFYTEFSSYMLAWDEIEKAKNQHSRDEYARSATHYEKAAKMHSSLRLWRHFAPNYSALAQLERAEDLSRRNKNRESSAAFQRASELFRRARKEIEKAIPTIENSDELGIAITLSRASDLRQEYCKGRIFLEEARISERKGSPHVSAEKYGLATEIFQRLAAKMDSEPERRELKPIICLCDAWRKMRLAEASMSPELYRDASRLFEEAKTLSSSERTMLLALGDSAICKALEAGAIFETTQDLPKFQSCKQHLQAAANYYSKAGFETASGWVNATQAMFDAYGYMAKAETEMEPEMKARLYELAERYLERSADLYGRTGYVRKKSEALDILRKVKEKRNFTFSLGDMLTAPADASSTMVMSAPSPTHENAVGLERFESASVEAHLSVPNELKAGEETEIGIDLVNVADGFGLLVRIEDFVPQGFEATRFPSEYAVVNGSIDLKGRRLDSLKTESIRIWVRPTEPCTASFSPRVIYADEAGKFRVCKPAEAQVTVNPSVAFEFRTEEAQQAFDFLIRAFADDYMTNKMPLDKSGWRSLTDIVERAKIPKSKVYGSKGGLGRAITELERRGFVETRVFVGERGRGGRTVRTRVAYDKDVVKRQVDHAVMKARKK